MALPFRKIAWPVDAFPEDRVVQDRTAEVLRVFNQPLNAEVIPVFVIDGPKFHPPFGVPEDWFVPVREAAMKAIANLSRGTGISNLQEPLIVSEIARSTRTAIRSLLETVNQLKADLLVVGTHGRSGAPRFFMGSFAETLLLHAHLPVLVVGPHQERSSSISRILYATDLTPQSEAQLPQAIEIAKAYDAELILYHAVPKLLEPALRSGVYLLGGGPVPWVDPLPKDTREQEAILDGWVNQVKAAGVKCRRGVEGYTTNVSDSIVEAAKREKADLLIQLGQSGPVESVLVGSITRRIVRTASCPVLMIRG